MLINRGMDKEDVVYIHGGILFSHEKEQNCAIFRDVDGPRECYMSEGSQKEKNKYCIFNAYMWNPGNWYRLICLQVEIEIQA